MTTSPKTTPSQGEQLAWLAGIIDGEGTVALYWTKQKRFITGFVIVNTDHGIIKGVEDIYKRLNIFYSKYDRGKYDKQYSFKSRKRCIEVVVRRREDTLRLAQLVEPYLQGEKKKKTQDVIEYLSNNKPKVFVPNKCKVCGQSCTKRKDRQFCSQKCWHEYAQGKNNPNYKKGQHTHQV